MADSKEDLKAQAEELGVEVDEAWTKAQIQEAIDAALNDEDPAVDEQDEQDEPKGDTYRNRSNVTVFVAGIRVKPGKEHTLTEADKKDERAMKRLARAVDMGLVEKV